MAWRWRGGGSAANEWPGVIERSNMAAGLWRRRNGENGGNENLGYAVKAGIEMWRRRSLGE